MMNAEANPPVASSISAIVVSHFEIAADHPCLPGHFPGRPVVPGVVVLDHVLAAIEALMLQDSMSQDLSLQRMPQASPQGLSGALRLPQVKFLQPLLPMQVARIELETWPATANTALRWRFRVLREHDAALLSSGEVQSVHMSNNA